MAKKNTKKKARTSKKNSKKNTSTSRKNTKDPYNFPKVSLEDAIKLAQAIDEKFAGHPTPADELVKAVGMHKPSDWRFLDLLRAGEFYGVTRGTGETATVEITDLGENVVAPSDAKQRKESLLAAFESVELFKKVNDHYRKRPLPDDEFVENTLNREFSIPKERVNAFKSVFQQTQHYLREFGVFGESSYENNNIESDDRSESAISNSSSSEAKLRTAGERKYLDDCFVIMPFGEWYDIYYAEIYAPAIKEAGFEPRRADELFNTGTVIEQIYSEIKKAKILVAELTGKNANVFYELGLSHARGKPVIFITSSLDDVPFDLRHLRIIVYDVRGRP